MMQLSRMPAVQTPYYTRATLYQVTRQIVVQFDAKKPTKANSKINLFVCVNSIVEYKIEPEMNPNKHSRTVPTGRRCAILRDPFRVASVTIPKTSPRQHNDTLSVKMVTGQKGAF
jgi:hypothetical protein